MSAIKQIPLIVYGQAISGVSFAVGSTVNFNLTCQNADTRAAINLTGGNVILGISNLNLNGNPKSPALISRQANITDAVNGKCTIPIADGDTAPVIGNVFKPGLYGADIWLTDSDGNRLQVLAFFQLELTPAVTLPSSVITPLPAQEPLAQGPAGPAGLISTTAPVLVNGAHGPVTSGAAFTLSLAAGGVTNALLEHSAVTVNTSAPISGGGAVSLGNSLSLSIADAAIANAKLANPSLSVPVGDGLQGGGTIALGGSEQIDLNLLSSGGLSKTLGDGHKLGIPSLGVVDSMINTVTGSKVSGDVGSALSGKFAGLNAKDYGAVGNDSTDNLTPFTNALAAIESGGIGTLYIPTGTYKFSTRLGFTTSNVRILGQGRVTLTSPHYTVLEFFSTCSNVTFENITFESTYVDNANLVWGVVQAFSEVSNEFSLSNIKFINCEFTCPQAAEAVKLINNTTHSETFSSILFDNCNFHDIGRGGLICQNTQDSVSVRLDNIVARNCNFSNLGLQGNVGTGQGVSFGGLMTNCVVDSCFFYNPEYAAIEYTDGGHGQITNNRFSGWFSRGGTYYRAISITDADVGVPGMVITGNQEIESSGQNTTWFIEFVSNSVISENILLSSGMYFLSTHDCNITNNFINSIDHYALFFDNPDCDNNKISGNKLSTVDSPTPFSVIRFNGDASVTENIVTDNDVYFSSGNEWDQTNGAIGNVYYLNRANSSPSKVIDAIGPTAARQHTIPSVASDTFALLNAVQTLTNKTLTAPVLSAPEFTGNTLLDGELLFKKEINHNIAIQTSTTSTTVGANLEINAAAGAAGADGGVLYLHAGGGGAGANGGVTNIEGGPLGAAGNSGSVVIASANTSSLQLGASGITTAVNGLITLARGLTASGSTANDFSGSTGAFKTSTGVSTFGGSSNIFSSGTVGPSSGQQHTLPAVTSDTFALIAAVQTLTNKTISGSSNTFSNIGNASLTNSTITATPGTGLSGGGSASLGGSFTLSVDTAVVVTLTGSQTLTNKTLTTPIINGLSSASGNADFSGSSGTFKTTSGASTFGGSSNTFTSGAIGPASGQQHTLPAVTSDTIALIAAAQTLTNKTISGASNTLSNIANASLTNSAITATAGTGLTGGGATSLGGSFTLGIDSTVATLTGSQVLTNKTLTTPIVNGLTSASGNADFSGSSGTFKTSTGASTFGGSSNTFSSGAIGPASGQQHTLPAVTSDTFALLAASQTFTNKTLTAPVLGGSLTGTFTLAGTPTLGASLAVGTTASFGIGDTTHVLTAVSTAKVIGGSTNTSGHTVPNVADDTFVLLAASQVLTNKTLTLPVITGCTSSGSSVFNLSGSTGGFRTSTGSNIFGGSANTFTNGLTSVGGDITFAKEVDRSIGIATSTTSVTVGASLNISAAAGAASAAGGTLNLFGGTGGSSANGGNTTLRAGAAGSGASAGQLFIGDLLTRGLFIGAAGIPIQVDGYLSLAQAKKIGTLINSASTIAPTSPVTHVDGTTIIQTITPPTDFAQTGVGGTLILIPDGLWTTNAAGNIAIATTAVVGKQLLMTYDNATSKWYPSY